MPINITNEDAPKGKAKYKARSESGEPIVVTADGDGHDRRYKARGEDAPVETTVEAKGDPTGRVTSQFEEDEEAAQKSQSTDEPKGAKPGPSDPNNKAVKASKSTTKKAS